jgi:hypothetical protein
MGAIRNCFESNTRIKKLYQFYLLTRRSWQSNLRPVSFLQSTRATPGSALCCSASANVTHWQSVGITREIVTALIVRAFS